MIKYYSQNGEDEWIDQHLSLPIKGFYLDIGCGHPTQTSNTAFLRDRKWEGLAIDGSGQWAADWLDIPDFMCAVIATKSGIVRFKDDKWWGRINPEGGERIATTIEGLLNRQKVRKIDFLSVDLEGSELDILKTFDFEKHDPPIVIAEYNAAHLPHVEATDSLIPAFMQSKGYSLKRVFEPANMIFTK